MEEFLGHSFETLLWNYQEKHNKHDKVNSDIKFFFNGLTRLLERQSAMFWHINYLDRYNLEDIKPLGLRVQIFPNLPNIGEEFRNRWEIMLKQCSKLII